MDTVVPLSEARATILATISRVLSKVLDRELPGVGDDTALIDGLGLDSTQVLTMLMDLEDTLDIEFDFDNLTQDNIETVGTVTDLILATVAAGSMSGAAPLELMRARRVAFGPGEAAAGPGRDPGETRYYADMTARYGITFQPAVLADAAAACYPEMGQRLLADIGPFEPALDLIVIGHTVPDLDIGRFVGCTLSDDTGGTATFAVTDAGLATSFAALRIAGEYARSPDVSQVLVVLLDQSVLPYDAQLPAGYEATRDAGVALLFGPPRGGTGTDAGTGLDQGRDPGGLVVRQHSDVDLGGIRNLLTDTLLEWPLRPGDTLVLGTGLDQGRDISGLDVTVLVAGPGLPASGLWWSLLDDASPQAGRRVALADYDAELRCLSVATLAGRV